MVTVAVPAETAPGERRVALVPEVVAKLKGAGLDVAVQAGAGRAAWASDDDYAEAGARIAPDLGAVLSGADIVVKVAPPDAAEASRFPEGAIYVGFLPLSATETLTAMAGRRITAFSLERLPRISRAQSMDALSSQSLVAGYKAA